jgi:hypothetical protein
MVSKKVEKRLVLRTIIREIMFFSGGFLFGEGRTVLVKLWKVGYEEATGGFLMTMHRSPSQERL